ncbi:hypothetical protein KM043_009353 [Ampulex compressa]|nr:hypothetical protein KM043_009353 [Ampulex compressa]
MSFAACKPAFCGQSSKPRGRGGNSRRVNGRSKVREELDYTEERKEWAAALTRGGERENFGVPRGAFLGARVHGLSTGALKCSRASALRGRMGFALIILPTATIPAAAPPASASAEPQRGGYKLAVLFLKFNRIARGFTYEDAHVSRNAGKFPVSRFLRDPLRIERPVFPRALEGETAELRGARKFSVVREGEEKKGGLPAEEVTVAKVALANPSFFFGKSKATNA